MEEISRYESAHMLQKRVTGYAWRTVCVALLLGSVLGNSIAQVTGPRKTVGLAIDAGFTYQQIDGFGVNANTWSWNKEFEPAAALMLDSLKVNLWRVIVETVENWEVKNDNKDPFTFNWKYYNRLYETPKFRKAWDMIAYLNKRGVTDGLMINFMGRVPLWMGGEVVKPEFEDEYVEMLVSFFYYAVHVKKLHIGLIAPMNEPDIRKEGPTVKPEQYVRLIRKFVERMDAVGLGHIKLVGPDVAGMDNGINSYIPLMAKDPVVMKALARFGLHSYAGYYANADSSMHAADGSRRGYWVTEWNAWCEGCDDGILGEYNYQFASKSMSFLIALLTHGARGAMAWEGYDSYYEHHAPSPFSYWGLLEFDRSTNTYRPRKNFFAFQHFSSFIKPGSRRIYTSQHSDSLVTTAFYDSLSRELIVVGVNKYTSPVSLRTVVTGLSGLQHVSLYYTDEQHNVTRASDTPVDDNEFTMTLPGQCIFTLRATVGKAGGMGNNTIRRNPEPADWYAGDIHVHRNCGDDKVLSESVLPAMMADNDLSVISLLADMGNGEVLYSQQDLHKVNGKDAGVSTAERIVHWDAEWHWDATYSRFEHQALGGHLVLLGLKEARQIWSESTSTVLNWAREQKAVTGFCHFQYLDDQLQDDLNCCIPVEYPVEVALGTVDFISEDVFGKGSPNNGNYNSESAIQAYYRLLNCGYRLGLAAGTDYPCNNNEPLGKLLTYVHIPGKELTYDDWIQGIKKGNTVVSRNAHNEFVELKAQGVYSPGDDIQLKKKGEVRIEARWTTTRAYTGTVELVMNGQVIARQHGTATPDRPLLLVANPLFGQSGWLAARRMDEEGHQVHSAPIYVTVNNEPMKAIREDVLYYVAWIDKMLASIAPGGKWNKYFEEDYETTRARYERAKAIYMAKLGN